MNRLTPHPNRHPPLSLGDRLGAMAGADHLRQPERVGERQADRGYGWGSYTFASTGIKNSGFSRMDLISSTTRK